MFGEKRLRASKRKENVRSPGKDVEKYLAQKLQLYKISRNKRVSFFKNIFGTVEKNGVVKDPDEIDEGVDRVKYDPKSIFIGQTHHISHPSVSNPEVKHVGKTLP